MKDAKKPRPKAEKDPVFPQFERLRLNERKMTSPRGQRDQRTETSDVKSIDVWLREQGL